VRVVGTHLRADGTPRGKPADPAITNVAPLRPALVDITGAIAYLGGPSRAKFYADLLPRLEIIKFGTRTLVSVNSLDQLIAECRKGR
jgi:hypothetical protein